MLSSIIVLFILSPVFSIYQTRMKLSPLGYEFQPRFNIQLTLNATARSRITCAAVCDQQLFCRAFDYDSTSSRCRLFEGDLTSGSISPSTSPTSITGIVLISPSLFAGIHNQPCQTCQENRFVYCSSNSSTCQCWPHTFWDGSICSLQLFEDDTCSQIDVCRTDLNLTCPVDCYGRFTKCSPVSTITNRNVTTIAGSCNGSCNETLTGGITPLHSQAGLFVSNNGTLYVGDSNSVNTVYAFAPHNFTGKAIISFSNFPTFIFVDDKTSKLYVTVFHNNRAVILPSNETIPPSNISLSCTVSTMGKPTGIVVDSFGNTYISDRYCNRVLKWAPNATSGVLIAGVTPILGNDTNHLNGPYGLFLDEAHSLLYVADRFNHRIQKFRLGNATGITVAGGNGAGSASNQLNNPTAIFISRLDDAVYICDRGNSRVQKWAANALYGVTIAGSAVGVAGNAPYLLNSPYDLWIHSNETYMVISDSGNCRVQRYSLL